MTEQQSLARWMNSIGKRLGIVPPLWFWFLQVTTPARDRHWASTPALAEFMQGWAEQANGLVELNYSDWFEIRGRARPFRKVELIEIGDGFHDALPASRLTPADRARMGCLLAERRVKWWLLADYAHDPFSYNCFIPVKHPKMLDSDERERAKMAYRREQ